MTQSHGSWTQDSRVAEEVGPHFLTTGNPGFFKNAHLRQKLGVFYENQTRVHRDGTKGEPLSVSNSKYFYSYNAVLAPTGQGQDEALVRPDPPVQYLTTQNGFLLHGSLCIAVINVGEQACRGQRTAL